MSISTESKKTIDKDVEDLKTPPAPIINPFKNDMDVSGLLQKEIKDRHPLLQGLIDVSDHILSFFLYLMLGLLIGLTLNYLFT
tara:strand:+ start:867 stop:1115 length:249 start_codon:yes stop_codon:yes gene_type:complete